MILGAAVMELVRRIASVRAGFSDLIGEISVVLAEFVSAAVI